MSATAAASPPQDVDWQKLLKGKILTQKRIQETTELIRDRYNQCCNRGQWDYRLMARLVNAEGLAAELSGSDPAKPSTEDKLQQVRNLLAPFEHLAPGLAYGGLHDAVLKIHNSSDPSWEIHAESLALLRLLLEGCTVTPAGVDPLNPASAKAVAKAMAEYLERAVEEGLGAKHAASVDHCLEGLYSLLRYHMQPSSGAAKKLMWEMHLPARCWS